MSARCPATAPPRPMTAPSRSIRRSPRTRRHHGRPPAGSRHRTTCCPWLPVSSGSRCLVVHWSCYGTAGGGKNQQNQRRSNLSTNPARPWLCKCQGAAHVSVDAWRGWHRTLARRVLDPPRERSVGMAGRGRGTGADCRRVLGSGSEMCLKRQRGSSRNILWPFHVCRCTSPFVVKSRHALGCLYACQRAGREPLLDLAPRP